MLLLKNYSNVSLKDHVLTVDFLVKNYITHDSAENGIKHICNKTLSYPYIQNIAYLYDLLN